MRQTVWAAAALTALATTRPVAAQLSLQTGGESSSYLQQQRQIEQENRRKLEGTLPATQKVRVDWGGWFDWYYFNFDDGVRERTQRTYDVRLFAHVTADEGIHDGYARMRLGWVDWNSGDAYNSNDDDFIGPNLERGWYQFDITHALRKYGGVDSPVSLKLKLGRDFVQTGSAYAIAMPLDHVQLQAEYAGFETTALIGRTPGSTPNIDRSYPVASESNRVFWIFEERYKGFARHEPFVYYARQSDHTREDPIDLLQNYDYDSEYIGFGSTGEMVRNLKYNTEWVIERGDSYGDRKFLHRDEVKAWAFDQELEYLFSHRTKPRASLEYMFASGDSDRVFTPTNAEGGNRNDHVDRSFIGFGFRDTGLALAPRLSNIHIWRAGASFVPVPEVERLKNLELGTNWFLYWKHKETAAISDPTANETSGYLGWEMDYYANYRITNDLSLTFRLGEFFPGEAYSETDPRYFFLAGLTWSF